MQKTCDICRRKAAELFDRVTENGRTVEYAYCQACYTSLLKDGKSPSEEAKKRIARIGKECDVCGYTQEKFKQTFLFGCPECYEQMRDIAIDSALKAQGMTYADLQNPRPAFCQGGMDMHSTLFYQRESRCGDFESHKILKSANECTLEELVKNNVVSSRIRLARNVRGMEFPRNRKTVDEKDVNLINGAYAAAAGLISARLSPMQRLTKDEKKALIERHIISLSLANNDAGAVIVEGDKRYGGLSVMLNEEDHIREQCVVDGFDLHGAYEKIKAYDDRLLATLPVAYDSRLGFLTACPTNLGTGMRASVMLFLPALKRAGAIEDALKTFKSEFGLTVRGVFGEGSDAMYDMYQISNSRTLGVGEEEIIEQVEQAAVRMCYLERVALEKLAKEQQTSLLDGISKSYAVLKGAYALTAQDLMKLLVDVKMGVILGVLPIKSTQKLDETIWSCTSSALKIVAGESSEERDKTRARIVREILSETT